MIHKIKVIRPKIGNAIAAIFANTYWATVTSFHYVVYWLVCMIDFNEKETLFSNGNRRLWYMNSPKLFFICLLCRPARQRSPRNPTFFSKLFKIVPTMPYMAGPDVVSHPRTSKALLGVRR